MVGIKIFGGQIFGGQFFGRTKFSAPIQIFGTFEDENRQHRETKSEGNRGNVSTASTVVFEANITGTRPDVFMFDDLSCYLSQRIDKPGHLPPSDQPFCPFDYFVSVRQ